MTTKLLGIALLLVAGWLESGQAQAMIPDRQSIHTWKALVRKDMTETSVGMRHVGQAGTYGGAGQFNVAAGELHLALIACAVAKASLDSHPTPSSCRRAKRLFDQALDLYGTGSSVERQGALKMNGAVIGAGLSMINKGNVYFGRFKAIYDALK